MMTNILDIGKGQRNYQIDLLKCVSMLMIVILHVRSHGFDGVSYHYFSFLGMFINVLVSLSIVGVNCFVLITGYFMSNKNIDISRKGLWSSYKRLLPMWIQVVMYSLGIYLILCFLPSSGVSFSISKVIEHGLPFLSNRYWFFTQYFLLVLISPILNVVIQSLSQKQYRIILIVIIVAFSIVPTINVFGNGDFQYSLVWMSVLYFVAGYLRRFEIKKWKWLLIYFLCSAFFFGGRILLRAFVCLSSKKCIEGAPKST